MSLLQINVEYHNEDQQKGEDGQISLAFIIKGVNNEKRMEMAEFIRESVNNNFKTIAKYIPNAEYFNTVSF